jgi:hypothetical protein
MLASVMWLALIRPRLSTMQSANTTTATAKNP